MVERGYWLIAVARRTAINIAFAAAAISPAVAQQVPGWLEFEEWTPDGRTGFLMDYLRDHLAETDYLGEHREHVRFVELQVATADLNNDGVDEIFFILTNNFTGNAPPSIDILQRDGEVWRHIGGSWTHLHISDRRHNGYLVLYALDSILEWDGGAYRDVPNNDASFFLSLDHADDDLDDPRDPPTSSVDDRALAHLLRHVGTSNINAVITDPAVLPRLESLLGDQLGYFLHNMQDTWEITFEHDYLFLEGASGIPVWMFAREQTGALALDARDGTLHVGLQSSGAVTIYGGGQSLAELPAPLSAWIGKWHGPVWMEREVRPLRWVRGDEIFLWDGTGFRAAELQALLDIEGSAPAQTLLNHPTVQHLLGARLNAEVLSYLLGSFSERDIGATRGEYLVASGGHDQRWQKPVDGDREAVIVVLRDDATATHVGIDAGGRQALYSAAATYAELPGVLKQWLREAAGGAAGGWARAPADLIWVREADELNAMAPVIANLVASDKKPPEVHEGIAVNRWDFGPDRALVERLVAETSGPEEFVRNMGLVGIGRYDVNVDGQFELFVHLYRWLGCAVDCPLRIFEGSPGARIEVAALHTYKMLDVWIDPASGYKTVFDRNEGLRWNGTDYEWFCHRRC